MRRNGDEERRRLERRARETGGKTDVFRHAVAQERVDGQAGRFDRFVSYSLWRIGEVLNPRAPLHWMGVGRATWTRETVLGHIRDALAVLDRNPKIGTGSSSQAVAVPVPSTDIPEDIPDDLLHAERVGGVICVAQSDVVAVALKAAVLPDRERPRTESTCLAAIFGRSRPDEGLLERAWTLDRYEEEVVDADDVRVYDNFGRSADRYTILIQGEVNEEPFSLCIASSRDPYRGVWLHTEAGFDPDDPGDVGVELVPWTDLVSRDAFDSIWTYRGYPIVKIPREVAERWCVLVAGDYFH